MAAQSKISSSQLVLSKQNFESFSASPIMPMTSSNSPSDIDLPLADPLGSDTISIGHLGQTGMHGDDHYGSGPCDGPSVWYCSSCGDGPMADWNPCCANCGHAYCSSCTVEST
jgi:hypothetical protein